jgi:hypothetical protein
MLSVVMLNVVMLSALAPIKALNIFFSYLRLGRSLPRPQAHGLSPHHHVTLGRISLPDTNTLAYLA